MSSSSRDNWERLVAAVVKRQQFLQLCRQQSRSPSVSTISSHSYSEHTISYTASCNLEPFPEIPSPQLQAKSPSVPQVTTPAFKNGASSRLITRYKLFSSWYRRRKSKVDKDLVDIPEDVEIPLRLLRRFSARELRSATENFRSKSVIASDVYRGRLADGSPVAIKKKDIKQDSSCRISIQRELEINYIASHPNVLHILGYCITPNEQLVVYPLMVNGSVKSWLRERRKSQPALSWTARKEIALGVARGVAYLHEEIRDKKIIHRDIKAANILLDKDFEAVVADFGLSLIAEQSNAYVEDAACGTVGHIAPEYLSSGRCSEKCDVFSYGVFLLELITGQRGFDLIGLADDKDVRLLLKRICKESKWAIIIDAACESNYMENVVLQLLQIAILCTEIEPSRRPKMSEVVRMFEDGDGLAQRWEELFKDELEKENNSSKNKLVFVDDRSIVKNYIPGSR